MFVNLLSYSLLGFIGFVTAKDLLADRRYCGYQHTDDYLRKNQNISIDEFPWLAQLIYDTGVIRCTGSIINNRYILTAAHCLNAPRVQLQKVRLGDYNVKTIDDCISFLEDEEECSEPFKDFDVEQTITHPGYNKRTGANDIGLIRLSKSILYSDFIRPICLPQNNTLELENRTKLLTSGWGDLGYNQEPTELKKKVWTELITYDECLAVFKAKNKVLITRDHFCVYEYEAITCHGDNGAPLMRSIRNQWEQVGVLNTGARVCSPTYTIFNKVSDYIDWIKAVLRP